MSESKIFEDKLDKIKTEVENYNRNLNESGIWLFVATLGCWSVDHFNLRALALVFMFLIFAHRLLSGLDSFKSFASRLKKQESEIDNASLDEKTKKSLKYDIIKFEKNNLSNWRIVKKVPAYYLSALFLLASMGYWAGYYA